MALKDALSAAKKVRPCLRDQFAMAALHCLVLCQPITYQEAEEAAGSAYAIADAMLKARASKEGEEDGM